MNTDFISNLFRTFNAKLITADNFLVEKILKMSLAISLFVYRRDRKKPKKNCVITIGNFDGNIKMKIDRSRAMGAALYWTGFHEFREFIFLHRFLHSDMVVVDVGANQGEYTLFSAKRLTLGKVIAFEPLPSIRKVLNENILLNNFTNIEVFNCGLSNREDKLVIHEIEDIHEGLATLYLGGRKSKAEIEIQLKTLDSVLNESPQTRIDFIKIDIEGGELNALKGSINTINKFKPVIMVEINQSTYEAAGYSISDIENFFSNLNYIPYQIGKRGKLIPCTIMPTFGNLIYKQR